MLAMGLIRRPPSSEHPILHSAARQSWGSMGRVGTVSNCRWPSLTQPDSSPAMDESFYSVAGQNVCDPAIPATRLT